MRNTNFENLVEKLIENPRVKKVSITGWQECGEYAGEDPRPIMGIEKWESNKIEPIKS